MSGGRHRSKKPGARPGSSLFGNGNLLCRCLCGYAGEGSCRYDYVHAPRDEFLCKGFHSIALVLREPKLVPDIAAIRVAKCAQAFSKISPKRLPLSGGAQI